VGDDADGVPGLPGFGEKGAAALLAAYDHIENIPARATDWKVPIRGADRLAVTLAEMKPQALLYRRLTTLVRDVPLEETLADLEWKGVPRDAFNAMCEELAAKDLGARTLRWS
jgi:5'-3' exonuclease